jgi:aspartate racemase
MTKIGILAGMGAAAGARFYSMLIEACQKKGAATDDAFPEIILYNVPVRGMDQSGITDPDALFRDLVKGVAFLNAGQVNRIVIVCHTVHIFIKLLQKYSKAPILNLVAITRESLNGVRLGVICSRTSKTNGLYAGMIETTDTQQDAVDATIQRAIEGTIRGRDFDTLEAIVHDMVKRGAEKVILGCTELGLIYSGPHTIDPEWLAIERLLA